MSYRIALSMILAMIAGWLPAEPLGTAFTYQGRLQQNGAPMTGTVDLRFSLWDAVSGSAGQIGLTIELSDVPVNSGLFTVQLNSASQFGPNAFNGEARWLNIAVRPGSSIGSFTALTPRQAVTVAPYAQHAAGPWVTSGTDLFYNSGRVGIGTATPTMPLDVHGPVLIVNTGDQADALWLGIERSWVFRQEGTGAGTALKLESVGGGGNKNFLIRTDGFVGVGATDPNAKLDVRGDIALGSSGQLRAAAGEENLRIVRGMVGPNGSPVAGSSFTGFTVANPGGGVYTITFTPPFAGIPAVTATAFRDQIEDPKIALIQVLSSSSVQILTYRVGDALTVANPFHFIAIGPR